jgi:Rod binding domain-containing protein
MDSAAALSPSAAPKVAALPPGLSGDDAHKVAQDFETFFLSQTFESMFADVGTDSLFGGGNGEQIYRSMLLQEYSKVAAKNGGIGIADAVQREILRLQETQ